jgi:hypothetical protein
MKVLEHEHQRAALAAGLAQTLERLAQALAHERRLLAGAIELERCPAGLAEADQLEHERERRACGSRQRRERVSLLLGRLPTREARGRAHQLPHHAERRVRAERVAARVPHLHRAPLGLELAQELEPEPRLAEASPAHQHARARAGVVEALARHGVERGELAVAPHARGGAPEHRAAGLARVVLTHEPHAPGLA